VILSSRRSANAVTASSYFSDNDDAKTLQLASQPATCLAVCLAAVNHSFYNADAVSSRKKLQNLQYIT